MGQQTQIETDNLSSARIILQQSIEIMAADVQTRAQLIDQRDSFRGQLDNTRQQAQIHRDGRQQLAVRESSLSTQLTSIRDGISRLESQLERLHERRNQLRVAFDIKDDPTEGYKEELEKQLKMRLAVDVELSVVLVEVGRARFFSTLYFLSATIVVAGFRTRFLLGFVVSAIGTTSSLSSSASCNN